MSGLVCGCVDPLPMLLASGLSPLVAASATVSYIRTAATRASKEEGPHPARSPAHHLAKAERANAHAPSIPSSSPALVTT